MSNRKKLTPELKKLFNERRRLTCLERYGNPTYNNMEKNLQTKQEKYGDSHYNNQLKHEETCIKKYGVKHHNLNPEIANKIRISKLSEETLLKYENTLKEKYGAEFTNVNLIPEVRAKYLNTMRKNNSFNKSKIEEDFYQILLIKYDKNDIKRLYKDTRYPFNCDFYIISLDLFIEVNAHWTHGKKPYNPNDEICQKQLAEWQEKAKTSKFYKNAIETWTIRDVKKLLIAKENNLNYLTFYLDLIKNIIKKTL